MTTTASNPEANTKSGSAYNKYNHLSKEDLIGLLQKRDATRKLGLVWERDEFEFEQALNDDFVTLELDSNLSVGQSPFGNILIEGDNFDALRYLHIAYKGRVKCIYIDPPYNLGGKDFIYNDNYVDKDDAYRHSKWLEFMYRRLLLAKDLLAEDGVIFVSIDDVESAHLTLLMDQVFSGMRVGTFVWRRRSGANDEKEWFLSTDHEYVLCYANKGFSFEGNKKDWSKAKDDGDARGPWVDGPLNQGKDIRQRFDAFYPIHNPETNVWYPCDPDSVWRFATKERANGKKIRSLFMEQQIFENRVAWPANDTPAIYQSTQEIYEAIASGTAPHNLRVYERLEQYKNDIQQGSCNPKVLSNIPSIDFWVGKQIGYGKPRFKRFTKDIKTDKKPVSTWVLPSSIKPQDKKFIEFDEVQTLQTGFTSEGTTLLSQMLSNKDFPYPKPMSLIRSLVHQTTDADSGHIVMDFFAGSGTTGHTVLSLNNEDDGNRSFVLVCSTESTKKEPDKNVCRDITAKRLKAAIDGYSYRTPRGSISVEGLGGEFAYMRCNRVPRATLAIDIRHDQIWLALQLIHTNSVSPFVDAASMQTLEGDENGFDIFYIPTLSVDVVDALRVRVESSLKPCLVYSWQPGVISQRFNEGHIKFDKIPDFLINRFGGVAL